MSTRETPTYRFLFIVGHVCEHRWVTVTGAGSLGEAEEFVIEAEQAEPVLSVKCYPGVTDRLSPFQLVPMHEGSRSYAVATS